MNGMFKKRPHFDLCNCVSCIILHALAYNIIHETLFYIMTRKFVNRSIFFALDIYIKQHPAVLPLLSPFGRFVYRLPLAGS